MPDNSAFICGIGLVTAVGGSTAQTAASVRAGISRYEESSVYNKRFAPMTMALVPEDVLPPLSLEEPAMTGLTSRQSRMLRLAHLAIDEALSQLPAESEVPLFLALPEPLPDPGRPPPVTDAFLDLLIAQTDAPVDRDRSQVFMTGRAAGFEALGGALDLLSREQDRFVLVGGVDTYIDLYLLGTLDVEDRVLSAGVMDGFAPGEGAGFLLLAAEGLAAKLHPPPRIQVHRPGLGVEPGHRYSQAPYQGDGLSSAVDSALKALDGVPAKTVLAGFNGENFGAKEWGVSFSRCQGGIDPEFTIVHPADGFGDVGAAFGPVLLGLAAVGIEKGYLRAPSLAWASSDAAPRGAACITSQNA